MAQDQGRREPARLGQEGAQRGPGRGRFPMPDLGFATLDANSDGVLDAGEIAAAAEVLARLDRDADGQITSGEVRPVMPQRPGAGGPDSARRGPGGPERERGGPGAGPLSSLADDTVKTLMRFDANADGRLSRAELPERMQRIFDRADDDKDGYLMPAEIQKFAAAQAPPPASMGRGGTGREMNFIRIDPLLAAVDADGHGAISAGELRGAPGAIRNLDQNGDRQLSRDEARPPTGEGRRL